MKHQLQVLILALTLSGAGASAQAATFSGHYPSGAEGIKAATLPPPGFYVRDYNLFYYADDFPGGPPDFKAVAYINGPRAIYMTDVKILGANYGLDLLIPFSYYQKQTTGYSPDNAGPMDQVFGLGPEISAFCPKLAVFTSLRYIREVEASDRPEGNTVSLTITKRW